MRSLSLVITRLRLMWVFPKWAWSGSREQFLYCEFRKFRHSKSSVGLYSWYPQLVRGRFVYDTYRIMEATRSRHGSVHMFITHCPTVILKLHNLDLFRTCTSSFCTVAWQFSRFQLTRRIARSLGDSWASCFYFLGVHIFACFMFLCSHCNTVCFIVLSYKAK